MAFHLAHPALTTTGRRRGKQKFRTAEAAARARELDASWKQLLDEHKVQQESRRRNRALSAPPLQRAPLSYRGSDQPRIPSLPFTGGPCTVGEQKVYTGDKIKGIGTMHKSNAVPIFTDEQAHDIAHMRR